MRARGGASCGQSASGQRCGCQGAGRQGLKFSADGQWRGGFAEGRGGPAEARGDWWGGCRLNPSRGAGGGRAWGGRGAAAPPRPGSTRLSRSSWGRWSDRHRSLGPALTPGPPPRPAAPFLSLQPGLWSPLCPLWTPGLSFLTGGGGGLWFGGCSCHLVL